MLGQKLFRVSGFPVGHIYLTGLGIVDDVLTEFCDLCHARLHGLDLTGQLMVSDGDFIRFLAERSVIQQLSLGQKIKCLRHLLQVEALRPPRISSPFFLCKFGLIVHQQIDALGLDFLCVLRAGESSFSPTMIERISLSE